MHEPRCCRQAERLIRQGWITPCSAGTLGSRGLGYIPLLPQTHKSEPILLLQTQGWSLGSPSLSFPRTCESRYLGPFSFLRSYEFDPSACLSSDPGVQVPRPSFSGFRSPCSLLFGTPYTEESPYPSFYLSGTQEFSHLSPFTFLGPGLLLGSGMSGPQWVPLSQDQEFRPSFLLLLRLQVSPTCPFPQPIFGRVQPSTHPFPSTWWCPRTQFSSQTQEFIILALLKTEESLLALPGP